MSYKRTRGSDFTILSQEESNSFLEFLNKHVLSDCGLTACSLILNPKTKKIERVLLKRESGSFFRADMVGAYPVPMMTYHGSPVGKSVPMMHEEEVLDAPKEEVKVVEPVVPEVKEEAPVVEEKKEEVVLVSEPDVPEEMEVVSPEEPVTISATESLIVEDAVLESKPEPVAEEAVESSSKKNRRRKNASPVED